MKSRITFLIFIFLIINVKIFSSPSFKNVLIIHSYHQGYEWTDSIHRAIMNILKKESNVKVFVEYMDIINNQNKEFLELLASMYRMKYCGNSNSPDIIIVSDDNAFNFILSAKAVFNDVPVIFCGVNDFTHDMISGYNNVTGVNERKPIKETIDIALKLIPESKTIAVVSGSRLTERRNLSTLKSVISEYEKSYNVVYLEEMEPDILAKSLSMLSEKSVVIYLSYLLTPSGRFLSPEEAVKLVTSSSKAPVFATSDFMITNGIVGGKVAHGYSQGQIAGEMALHILKGVKVKDIPVLMESPDKFIFDDVMLSKFNIPDYLLPPGSILVNHTTGRFIEEWHKGYDQTFFVYELFEKHGAVMLLVDPKSGIIIDANEAALKFYGYPKLIGKNINSINTLTEKEILEEMTKARALQRNHFEFKHKLSNDDIRNVNVYSYPININNTDILFSIVFDVTEQAVAENANKRNTVIIYIILSFIILFSLIIVITLLTLISQRKRVQNELKNQLIYKETLLDAIPNPVFYKDNAGRYIGCNRLFETFTGRNREDIIGKTVFDLVSSDIAAKYYEKDVELYDDSSMIQTYEWIAPEREGEKRNVIFHKAALHDSKGRIDGLVGIITDITELKKSEQKLIDIIKEKKILIQELYHRTKNNMQVISSMIALQTLSCKDNRLKVILRDIDSRIKAMSLVHQKLYQSKDLSNICVSDYIKELTDMLLKGYERGRSVKVNIESDNIILLIDIAVPCGLVVNELITNSLKYAFSERSSGLISIDIKESESGYIDILYSDDGIGLAPGFDWRNTSSLGMMMMVSLVEHQLNGSIEIWSDNGMNCSIRFKNNSYKERVKDEYNDC